MSSKSPFIASQRSAQDGIDPSCIFINMLGQDVNVCHPNTASGYYVESDEAVAASDPATRLCPPGLREGRMVIKGLPATENTPGGYIRTCGGTIFQQDMPDIHIIDWQFRIFINVALLAIVVIMLLAIGYKLLK